MSADQTIIKLEDLQIGETLTDNAKADALRRAAQSDPEAYWSEVATRIDWIKPFTKVKDVSYDASDLHIKWFEDGVLNACVNCLDRHLPERANDIAIIWEGDDPSQDKKITYAEAFEETSRMANLLKARGVSRGDRVIIYMPMIPEVDRYAMLACARLGAVHSQRSLSVDSRPEALKASRYLKTAAQPCSDHSRRRMACAVARWFRSKAAWTRRSGIAPDVKDRDLFIEAHRERRSCR